MISILNIGHVSSFADYFVIASGDVSTQVKALTEAELHGKLFELYETV